jgi:hypothetical protein
VGWIVDFPSGNSVDEHLSGGIKREKIWGTSAALRDALTSRRADRAVMSLWRADQADMMTGRQRERQLVIINCGPLALASRELNWVVVALD